MKRTRFSGVAMMGLLLGCATASPQQTPAAKAQGSQRSEAAVADAKKDPDHTLVCEDVSMTGSHLPQRVCRTLRQVNQEREAAQKAVREAGQVNPQQGD
jgi:type IV pilus biogenesis protein CpaD/CtpE